MKTLFLTFILSLLFLSLSSIPASLAADDLLDGAYHEQYDLYNSQIADFQAAVDSSQSLIAPFMKLYKQYCEPYRPEFSADCGSLLHEMMKPAHKLDESKAKIKEVTAKKVDLKIKVLEHSKQLPPWWKN